MSLYTKEVHSLRFLLFACFALFLFLFLFSLVKHSKAHFSLILITLFNEIEGK